MTPLFLFLASSFNTELVYVILKGITQFSYLINMDGDDKTQQTKLAKMKFKNENGDLTIFLNQIKIKDFDKWSQM